MEKKKMVQKVGSPNLNETPILQRSELGWTVVADRHQTIHDDEPNGTYTYDWDREIIKGTNVLMFY